jgi:hypothetical protein
MVPIVIDVLPPGSGTGRNIAPVAARVQCGGAARIGFSAESGRMVTLFSSFPEKKSKYRCDFQI